MTRGEADGSALSDDERAQARAAAAQARRRAAERVAALERAHADIVSASAEAVRDDEHDPEGATVAFEREQTAALLGAARTDLVALETALERLDGPEAGRCSDCGAAIGLERLLARPATARCVACSAAAARRR